MGSGLLSQRFREEVQKSKNAKMSEAIADVMYPTGFPSFDYLNGYKVFVKKPNGEEYYYNAVGIMDGSSVCYIGRAHSGKTTIALQTAANIIRPFPNAVAFIDDIEGGQNSARRQLLTGFTPEEMERRFIYRNAAVTAENFYERIAMIYDEKLSHRDEYEYDTGLLDSMGRPIYKLVPTVYVLDSIAMLAPDKLTEEEELSGQMSVTATAKTNTAVFKRIVPKLKAANIILLSINHINQKIEINAFTHTKSQMAFLKQNETLPGGNAVQYLANNMIRIDDGAILKKEDGLGVNGKIVDFSLVKSRSNAAGRSVPMVFTTEEGFDPILSVYMFLKSAGYIVTGTTCYLKGYENLKFRQKEFKDKLIEDPEFAKAFATVSKEALETLLAQPVENYESKRESMQNIINSILGV